MSMTQRSEELAENMSEAGITPGNEDCHPSYNKTHDTISYSHEDGTPLSETPYGPCNLTRHEGEWTMFDEWGARHIQITWEHNMWAAGPIQE